MSPDYSLLSPSIAHGRDYVHDRRQEQRFTEMVLSNPCNARILDRLPDLDLPDCYLVAGCLFQTVWNCLSGQAPGANIADYDVFYCDRENPGWDAEDAVMRRADRMFADLGVQIQVRNQARVHLWYESRFGICCSELDSTRDGIDHFLNQSSCYGMRRSREAFEVYAPFGFDDLFSMTVRPNPRRELPSVYYEKARRWSAAWPGLRVLHWQEPGSDVQP